MQSKPVAISFFLALTLLISPAAVTFLRVDAQNMTNATTLTNATNATVPIEVPPLVPSLNETTEPIVPTTEDNATAEVPPPAEVPPLEPETNETTTATPTSNVTIVSSNSLFGFDQFTGLNTITLFGIALNEGPADSTNTTLMTALFDFNGTIIAANTSTMIPSTILVNQSVPIAVTFSDLDIVGGVFNAAFYQQQADNGTIFFGVFPLPPLPPAPPIDGGGGLPPVDGGGGFVPLPPADGGGGGGELPPAPEQPPTQPAPPSLQECLDSYPNNQDICTIGGEIDCNTLIASGVFDITVTIGSVDPFGLDADKDGIGCELMEGAAAVPPELITPPGANATNMTAPITNATEPLADNATEPSEVNSTLADSSSSIAAEEPPSTAEEDQQAAEESQDDQPQQED